MISVYTVESWQKMSEIIIPSPIMIILFASVYKGLCVARERRAASLFTLKAGDLEPPTLLCNGT